MTDFIGSLLNQMSQQFNNTATTEEINLDKNINLDKTLKWKGLHQNQFAAKDGKTSSVNSTRKSKRVNEEKEEEPTATQQETDEQQENKMDLEIINQIFPTELEEGKKEVEEEMVVSEEIASKIEEIDPPEAETLPVAVCLEEPAAPVVPAEEKQEPAPVPEKPAEDKKAPKPKTPKTLTIGKSDRSLRSKVGESEASNLAAEVEKSADTSVEDATPIQSATEEVLEKPKDKPDEPVDDLKPKRGRKRKANPEEKAKDVDVVEPPPLAVDSLTDKPIPVEKRGRQRKNADAEKCPEESTPEESPEKSESESNSEKPRLILTIRKDKTTISTAVAPEVPAIEGVTPPKKRGRKPKSEMAPKNDPSPTKKSPRLSRDGSESILASAMARKEKQNDGPPTRLSRRIRPTAKILASEELRQEFEYQHLSRLHASEEHLESTAKPILVVAKIEEPEETPILVETEKLSPRECTPVKEIDKPLTLEDQIPISIIPNHQVVIKLTPSAPLPSTSSPAQPSTSPPKSVTFAAAPVKPSPPQKACPEPEQFLHDIKNSKLNFHRSPEDNKKLNKKQQKRLLKLKEKHFNMLGLRKTPKLVPTEVGKQSATESESDDNEEFVPSKKVVSVGRPNVTLRSLRQQKHQLMPPVPAPPGVKIVQLADKEIPLRGRRPQKEKILPIVTSVHNFPSPSSSGITRMPSKIYSSPDRNIHTPISTPSPTASTSSVQRADNFLCTCAEMSKYFVRRNESTSYCVAIDEIDGQKIGCSNEMVGELLNLRRPSVKASYMILCRSHEKRLLAHNCCAGCGVFLTKGIFMLCNNKHFFHRNCATKFIYNAPYDANSRDFLVPQLVLKCPHCGTDAPVNEISITFKCSGKAPVFSPNRDVLKPAKMGTSNSNSRNSTKPSPFINIEKLVPHNILEILQQATVRLKSQAPKVFDARDFFYAIRSGEDVHRLAEIIVSGFDVTTPLKEFHNETCLHLISNFGTLTMAYMCLSRVPSTNYLNFKDNEMRTAMMCAVVGGKNDILQLLIYAGADATIKGPDGMTALHLAAKIGNLTATQIMLDFYRQSMAISRLAIFINSVDDGRWSALVWAAENGHTDIVAYLLRLDADVTLCDTENNTVLHWAVLSGKLETLLPILRKNVNINGQNMNGDTALHIACRQANTQLCVLLLANGASMNINNISNETPMNCILDLNSECYRVLQLNSKLGGLGAVCEKKVYCHDISNGREQHPIQILGASPQSADDDPILPDFKYITKNILLQNNIQIDHRISQMRVCTCSDNCISDSCQCGQISIQNWYTLEGRLIEDFNYQDPPMIFECNDVCCCSKLLCKNRIVQNGIRLHFQVFECEVKRKGFGVKCLTKITKGSFISEYTGEILTDVEADRRTDDSYFFDLGASEHCIDANLYGNVSRFFNHSCSPNVVPIRVYYDHQDLRFPKIAFFASRDVEVGEEITFDYGEKFWMVKHKSFTCYCGQPNCRYSSDTIRKTLDDYNQRNRSSHCE